MAFNELVGGFTYDYQEDDLEHPQYWPRWVVNSLGEDYFANVVSLNLRHSRVTDEELKHLNTLPALERLNLGDTQVTDEGLRHLEGLQALRGLNLTDTQITDEGLKHLERLEALEWLVLYGTQVTDKGVAQLQEKLPNNCGIRYSTLIN